MGLSAAERARYARHLALAEIGVSGQERLKAARVLVVGAGGLGSPAAMYLAACGVGTLGVVDFDRVELSNLQRQLLFDNASLGEEKAAAARARLERLNPEITVIAHALELRAANIRAVLEPYEVILDGSDRHATRYLVNDACVLAGKPLVSAAIHCFEGQVTTIVPGRGPCYRCLFADVPEGAVANCAEAGVLGVLPGVLGAIQATEAIKLVTGIGEPLIGRLLTYDALQMRFDELPVARRRDCAVCGEQPSIRELSERAPLCTSEPLAAVRRLSAAGLAAELAADRGGELLLIDVRDPLEFRIGHLPGAINVPVVELAQRLGELPRARTAVFICRSGARSLTACKLALAAGAAAAAHLEGGLIAWTREVDARFPLDPAGGART